MKREKRLHHHHHPVHFRRSIVPISTGLSFGLSIAIFLIISHKEPQLKYHRPEYGTQQTSGAAPSVPNDVTVPQTAQQTAPSDQIDTGEQLITKGELGVLQRGVTPDEVTVELQVHVVKDFPGFDQTSLTAHTGDVISLTFENDSDPTYNYQHNWVLVKPDAFGAAMIQGYREGLQQNWTPKGPDILARTTLLKPGQSQTIIFRAPDQKGDYPFLCTFPGHAMAEHGTLHVD